jgi:hypothetical protein
LELVAGVEVDALVLPVCGLCVGCVDRVCGFGKGSARFGVLDRRVRVTVAVDGDDVVDVGGDGVVDVEEL